MDNTFSTTLDYDESGLERTFQRASTPVREQPECSTLEMSIIGPQILNLVREQPECSTLEMSIIGPQIDISPWICDNVDEGEQQLSVLELDELLEKEELVLVDEWKEDGLVLVDASSVKVARAKTTKEGFRNCGICSNRSQNLARHMKSHLPAYVSPYNCCWVCMRHIPQPSRIQHHQKLYGCGEKWKFQQGCFDLWVFLMNGLLRQYGVMLGKPGVTALCSYVASTPELHAQVPLSPEDTQLMHHFETINCYPVADTYSLDPVNSVGGLTHWRILFNLLKELTVHKRQLIQDHCQPLHPLGIPVSMSPPYETITETAEKRVIDSHFHQEKLEQRLGVSSWEAVCKRAPPMDPGVQLEAAVTCYAFPESWPKPESLHQMTPHPSSPPVMITIGWHPTRFREVSPLERFRTLIEEPKCIAVGEMGLDYFRSETEQDRFSQRELLRKLLPHVVASGKAIILHCREEKHHNMSATRDTISILERSLPRDWPVYVHCFNGGVEHYTLWLQAFPMACFGISPIILGNQHHPELKQVVRAMDPLRLLLETDAPYLPVPGAKTPFPIMVAEVGAAVARIRGVPAHVLLETSRLASRMLYRM